MTTKSVFPVLSLLLLFSCKSSKNMQLSNSLPAKNPQSAPAIAPEGKTNPAHAETEEVVQKNYQGSSTRLFDLLHTRLEVSFDWENSWLMGKATLDLQPYFYPANTLFLHARGMDIYKIQLKNGNNFSDLPYRYEHDSLKINLDKEYSRQEKITVYIEYKAKPEEQKSVGSAAISSNKGLFFINPKNTVKNKMPQIWTQGETQSNSVWFPTIDQPNERMTEEIFITVDNKYTTLSNGSLVNQIHNNNGSRTDHWKMELPHAPYLVMMAIGEFQLVKDKWKDKEVNYYVEKEFAPHAKAIFGNTPEMMQFYSDKLGVQYPWSKYAQVVARDYVSGAMENTTATLHGDFVYQTERELLDGNDPESVIAHELFHQWFGDLVTCESWSNLPLNESFATYGEYLWMEYKYGLDAADAHSYKSRQGYFSEAERKKVNLIRFDYLDKEEMFDGHSYNKGGQILHMLRKYVGDEAFFASLKLYLEKNKFTSVEVHQLRLAFEEISGEDLNWFFNQWFLSKGHPQLSLENNYNPETKTLQLNVTQKQDVKNCPLFRLPLYVDIYFNDGTSIKKQREQVLITKEKQSFNFIIPQKPLLVNFDAEQQLLFEKTETKSVEEYVFQYKNCPKYLNRLEALNNLKENIKNPLAYETIKLALSDKWQGLRILAINLLNDVAKEKELELKPLLLQIARKDEVNKVKSEAIKFLSRNYTDAALHELYLSGLQEKSYTVIGASLYALSTSNPQLAFSKAKELENESSAKIRFPIMELYANQGNDENNAYFVQQKQQFKGFEIFGFINIYAQFLKRCQEETVLSGAALLKECVVESGNNYVKFMAKKAIKDQANRFEEKENVLLKKMNDSDAGKDNLTKQLKITQETKLKLKEIGDSF